jgi:hypothetical protein
VPPHLMLRGLLDLARGAQTAPVPSCSCAKGLAVGMVCLQSALRGEGFALPAAGAAAAPAAAPAAQPPPRSGGGGRAAAAAAPQQQRADAGVESAAAAAFHSLDPLRSGLAAHDLHALRSAMLHAGP